MLLLESEMYISQFGDADFEKNLLNWGAVEDDAPIISTSDNSFFKFFSLFTVAV